MLGKKNDFSFREGEENCVILYYEGKNKRGWKWSGGYAISGKLFGIGTLSHLGDVRNSGKEIVDMEMRLGIVDKTKGSLFLIDSKLQKINSIVDLY